MSTTYTKRAKEILAKLDDGKTRDEIAEDYDYSSWKSLDIYMRRKGFRYDGETYVPDEPEVESIVPEKAGSKETLIISLFDDGKDPRTIAKRTGFDDHRELANFMEKRGYSWSSQKENYLREEGPAQKEQNVTSISEKKEAKMPANAALAAKPPKPGVPAILEEYLPLLRKLKAKEEELDLLLAKNGGDGKVPKYAVPGESSTKSIYMSSRLIGLLEEFSDMKNVSQREIVEGALVEYFESYGYKEETHSLLNRK